MFNFSLSHLNYLLFYPEIIYLQKKILKKILIVFLEQNMQIKKCIERGYIYFISKYIIYVHS